MIQTALAQLLDDEGLGDYVPDATGGDLFVDMLPDAPDQAVQIRAIGGPSPDGSHPYTTRRVQLLVRGDRDPRTAGNRAHALWSALHGRAGDTWPGGVHVVGAFAVAPPAFVGLDQSRRVTYSFHLMVETQDATDQRGGW